MQGSRLWGGIRRPIFRSTPPKISRRHARIVVNAPHATIEDLASKNGTFVRGVRIRGPMELQDGDKVRIGRLTFVFRVDTSRSTETEGLSGSDVGSE